MIKRIDGRSFSEMRDLRIEVNVTRYAEGSCMVYLGHTQILCTASVDERVPSFLRGSGKGWVTAEYAMLPRATHSRSNRLKQLESARSKEIQRFIGRSLRGVCDLVRLGERQVRIDCDVIQADGGTRTASVIGGYVALGIAIMRLQKYNILDGVVLLQCVGALSCGVVEGELLCDLCYEEDSTASSDANFVLSEDGRLVEVQASAERDLFSGDDLFSMLSMVRARMVDIFLVQQGALSEVSGGL